ncbi:hypothetical protein V5O48_009768 [Marasmius crinis-equi]|uniref:Uncharacterized protein n=1 Tax=Marasmius crinis-equi TaxID=585013 RepID=A0ABR3FA70_9AGAR
MLLPTLEIPLPEGIPGVENITWRYRRQTEKASGSFRVGTDIQRLTKALLRNLPPQVQEGSLEQSQLEYLPILRIEYTYETLDINV